MSDLARCSARLQAYWAMPPSPSGSTSSTRIRRRKAALLWARARGRGGTSVGHRVSGGDGLGRELDQSATDHVAPGTEASRALRGALALAVYTVQWSHRW